MALFGLKYYCEFRSKYDNIQFRIEIEQRGYSGANSEMHAAAEPLHVEWERRGDEFYEPVKGSEATLEVLCYNNFEYTSLYTADARQYRMTVYRNAKMYWRGFLCADTYSEAFDAPPYVVKLKAIDGFSLLKDIPFLDDMSEKYKGKMSLLTIVNRCLDVLELDLPIAEWIGLYLSVGDKSTLVNVELEAEQMYEVYNDLTYRDAIELCLKEFGAQIFQARGVIHIRRIVSLLENLRPSEFWLEDKRRPLYETLWRKGCQIDGSATMEINPALRSVKVELSNRSLSNLSKRMGLFDPELWSATTDDQISFGYDDKEEIFIKNGTGSSKLPRILHRGYRVEMSSAPLHLKFDVSGSGCEVQFIIKLSDGATTRYYDGSKWLSTEFLFVYKATNDPTESYRRYTYDNVELEITDIPFTADISLIFVNTTYNVPSLGLWHHLHLHDFDIAFEIDDIYEKYLSVEESLSYGNNKALNINIPIADAPQIPNKEAIYTLYLLGKNGKPTSLWHDDGKSGTLVHHLISSARRLRSTPKRQLNGLLDCKSVVDLNTVIRDDKYANADFYVNYLELNALEDNLTVELCEFRSLLSEAPQTGDDCVLKLSLKITPKFVAKCGYKIFVADTKNVVWIYNTYNGTVEKMNHAFSKITYMSEGVDCVVIIDNNYAYAFDVTGRMIGSIHPSRRRGRPEGSPDIISIIIFATFSKKRGWIKGENDSPTSSSPSTTCVTTIKELTKSSPWLLHFDGVNGSVLMTSDNYVVITTGTRSYYYDFRLHTDKLMRETIELENIYAISDKLILSEMNTVLSFFMRTDITLDASSRVAGHQSTRNVTKCDLNNDLIAVYSKGRLDPLGLHYPNKDINRTILNKGRGTRDIVGVKVVAGDIYIVDTIGRVFKYIRQAIITVTITPVVTVDGFRLKAEMSANAQQQITIEVKSKFFATKYIIIRSSDTSALSEVLYGSYVPFTISDAWPQTEMEDYEYQYVVKDPYVAYMYSDGNFITTESNELIKTH